jgi:aminoglycoside phosphotransferase (APT) family kinase protein
VTDETIAVRAEEAIAVDRLEPYLRARLPRTEGAFAIRQFGGGHANLTYLASFGTTEYVVRRPPLGPVPPGAHDMRREFRVLQNLYRGFAPAPRAYLLCTDAAIVGADFFVMERRAGIAFRHDVPEAYRDSPDVLRGVGEMLVDTLADLHAVDPASVGLGDLGKPEGFLARQLRGWTKRWHAARTPDVTDGAELIAWLGAHVPEARRTALVHNDFKLDNLLLAADDPRRCTAVLDWDMCTRGEPLMDLGYLLALWLEPAEAADRDAGWMPTWRAGFPTRREAAERYARRTGADLTDLPWYVIFNVFRFAAILQQIYVRYVRGQTTDPRFAAFGRKVDALVARGGALAR